MTVLDAGQCLQRKAEDHNTVKAVLWKTSESSSL